MIIGNRLWIGAWGRQSEQQMRANEKSLWKKSHCGGCVICPRTGLNSQSDRRVLFVRMQPRVNKLTVTHLLWKCQCSVHHSFSFLHVFSFFAPTPTYQHRHTHTHTHTYKQIPQEGPTAASILGNAVLFVCDIQYSPSCMYNFTSSYPLAALHGASVHPGFKGVWILKWGHMR